MSDNLLHIAMTDGSCHLLGPGTRAVIWVSGCRRSCPGCISSFRDPRSARFHWSPEEAAGWFLSLPDKPTGLTISGGEPFLQPGPLAETIRLIRQERAANVIVYTGYTLGQLQDGSHPDAAGLLMHTDLLIDGPYLNEHDHGEFGRGSANQRIIRLSEAFTAGEIERYYRDGRPRSVRIVIQDDGQAAMVGVPGARAARVWQNITQQPSWRTS